MPLPVLPPDNTARYKFFYHNAAHQHVTTIRAAGAHSPSNVGSQFDVLMTALAPILNVVTIDKVEFAATGSNVFNPVTSGIEGNTYGSGTGNPTNAPWFYGFVGRTSGGRKARFMIFSAVDLGVNYRFAPGENAATDAAVLVPQASSNAFYGIDGIKPTWYGYVNAGADAYWQRKGR
jgi:hypothetical protein